MRFRNAQAPFQGNIDRCDGNRIVVAEHAVWLISGKQHAHGIVALLPVLPVRSHAGTDQPGIKLDSVFIERKFVAGKAPKSSRELQASDMRNAFASHRNQMFRGHAPDRDIVDANIIRLESWKVTIDQDKWNSLFIQLLEFCGRYAA